MQIAPGAELLLLDSRSHRSAYRRRTCVAAGCDAQRVAVGPLSRPGIVSVRGPIPAALHRRRLRHGLLYNSSMAKAVGSRHAAADQLDAAAEIRCEPLQHTATYTI